MAESIYRGRFAPSPTGDLHLGSAATALVAWLRARARSGSFVVRVEDIDTPRVLSGCEAAQLDDLRWLGLDWDEGPDVGGSHGPYRQSERTVVYEEALTRLAARHLVYRCDCSRKEIAGVASAPHGSEEGPRYPGTCRAFGMSPRPLKRPAAIRFAARSSRVVIDDAVFGRVEQDVLVDVGDFVLRRGDGVFAYQLAVVVDDIAMAITEVVRGADLLGSAPRQILLAEHLGARPWSFAHVPLIVAADGARLEKRNPRQTLRGLRQLGVAPERIVAVLAKTLNLDLPLGRGEITPKELLRYSDGTLRVCASTLQMQQAL